jgi:hypothetical protein
MERTIHSDAQPVFPGVSEAHSTGVPWAAVIAGAFSAAALSLILLALGSGLGLSSVSPWSNVGASASAVGTAAIVWLIVNEILASAMGGYVAGRLRPKWTSVHTDEVYFRDTAHGFLAWAVAVVITASFLTTAAASITGGLAISSESRPAGDAAIAGDTALSYFVDALFRSDRSHTADETAVRAEAGRIFANALRQRDLPAEDESYLEQLVMAQTGVNQTAAQKQVSAVFAQARQSLDAFRKSTARLLLWLFVALLIGAFCAGYAATIGGRQRDHTKAI